MLSVLDLAPVPEGVSPTEALARSVELIRLAEDLGFRRYWVAEHHNMPGIASSSPAVLIAHLAAATSRIRVGSGGVMLPNHAPLVIAEQFGLLASLHPGRIDLGLGRAPGSDQATARALRRAFDDPAADKFPEQLGELVAFLHGSFPDDHPYRHIRAVPRAEVPPSIWLLGSSGYSAQLAGMLGLPFSFAHHFAPAYTEPAVQLYRDSFRPSAVLDEPYVAIGAAVLGADTDEEAQWLHGPSRLQMLRLRTGRPGPLSSPEDADAYPWTAGERNAVAGFTSSHIVGSPDTVRAGLTRLASMTGADELIVTTNTFSQADRLRSFRLVADVMAPAAA
ncbi:LLM class flavin-dependent oxidoreductase [Acidiferrimicrobium sp. IK]|uniref:LLM class flavin-dependent oxidoreductase n=1 Tax=Acidiferrimicrobium sp. IK TaxID=2871700 RepID=UPI0021CB12BB|nr:LLM class flavin-dependent oxidoreductase [Acidiferrimicrobium sp. IK]